jgi:hypothetical protein
VVLLMSALARHRIWKPSRVTVQRIVPWPSAGQAERARGLACPTLVITNPALILANALMSPTAFCRLRVPNAALWWIVGRAPRCAAPEPYRRAGIYKARI